MKTFYKKFRKANGAARFEFGLVPCEVISRETRLEWALFGGGKILSNGFYVACKSQIENEYVRVRFTQNGRKITKEISAGELITQ